MKIKLSILISVFLFFTSIALLTAGGARAASRQPGLGDDEYYELMFLRDYDVAEREQNADKSVFRNYVKEKFNIGWREIHFAGDMQERLMLDLAGGNYPDIINPRYTNVLKAYAEAGALLNLGELLEKYGPNVLKRHAERLPVWKAMSGTNDGNIWVMTMWQPDLVGARSLPELQWLIRSDILEQQGYPQILDENDLYEVLRRGLADNPTTNGRPTVAFSQPLNSWGTNGLQCITYTYNMGRSSHMTFNRGTVFDFDANEFIDVTLDHSYRNGLEFFNRLWRNGLYDRDAVTDGWDEFEAKMREGRALAAFFYVWPWNYDFNPNLQLNNAPYRYVPFAMQLSSQRERKETMIYPQSAGEVWSSIAITKNAKNPERIAKLLNWQASDEGMILAGWGREGVEYTIVNGRRVPTEEYFYRTENDPNYGYELYAPSEFGFYLGVDNNGQSFRITNDAYVTNRTLDPIVKNVWAQYGWTSSYDMYFQNKNFVMDTNHQIDLKAAVPTLTPELHRNWEIIDADTHDFTMRLITAASPEAFNQIFKDMLARRAELGQGEIVRLWNAEYKEMRRFYGLD